MANFREAYETGLSAYDASAQAQREIADLLEELGSQIADASDGTISVKLESGRDVIQAVASLAAGLLSASSVNLPVNETRLIAVSESGTETLCQFEIAQHGYPVRLRYGKERVSCHDRESLEVGLQELLKQPATGGKLRKLLQRAHPSA